MTAVDLARRVGEPVKGTVIVQNNLIEHLAGPLAIAARRRGLTVADASFVASGTVFPKPPFEPPVFVYGSAGFLRHARANPDIAPLLSWSGSAFRASSWNQRVGGNYIGAGGRVMTAKQVSNAISATGRLAVRPEHEHKAFPGGVYDEVGWTALGVLENVECWAARPSEIKDEIRVWIVRGSPVYAARYRQDGETRHSALSGLETLAPFALAKDMRFMDDIVIDIARLRNQTLKVIEANCIHTSGWYVDACDAVLDAWFA